MVYARLMKSLTYFIAETRFTFFYILFIKRNMMLVIFYMMSQLNTVIILKIKIMHY